MSFKCRRVGRALWIAIAITGSVTQTSCLKDRAPSTLDLGLGKGLSGCLSQFDTTIRNYFNGKASDADVTQLFDCTHDALDLFIKHTRGEQSGIYLPGELKGFLQKYFLGSKILTDALVSEGMTLKQAILGGQELTLKQDELRLTMELLEILKREAIRLRRFMPIEAEHFNDLRGDELHAGLAAIDQAGAAIGAFLVRAQKPYLLESFSRLLLELQQLFEKGQEGRGPRVLRDNLEIFGAGKRIIFGGPNNSIDPVDWTKLLSIGSRWYSTYLRLSNLDARRYVNWRTKDGNAESWYHGVALRDFARLGESAYSLLQESLKQQGDKTVVFKDIHHMIDSMTEPSREDWNTFSREEAWRPFDPEMSAYLKSVMISVTQRLLGGYETTPSGRDAPGITPALFERLWTEFASWFTQQRYLERIYTQLGGEAAFDAPGFTREKLLSIPEFEPRSLSFFERYLVPADMLRSSIFDMKEVIQHFRPLFAGKDTKIYFADKPEDPKSILYSYENLSKLNWIRSVARSAIRGYVKSRDIERARSYGGLTEDEMDHLYWDYRSFGIKIGLFDPTTTMSGVRRFREANLFTSVADGGQVLTLDEGMELFAFLLSAGSISNSLHDGIAESCPVGPKDEFGHYEIESTCFRKKFSERLMTKEWAHMPGMVRYFQTLNATQKDEFMKVLETAARKGGDTEGQMIDHYETDVMVMIPHYVEATFNRFDQDFSGTITLNEALIAFPVFRRALLDHPAVKEAGLTDDADLRAIFTYLLKEGTTPSSVQFAWWRYVASWEGKIHADRGLVLKIFANISN